MGNRVTSDDLTPDMHRHKDSIPAYREYSTKQIETGNSRGAFGQLTAREIRAIKRSWQCIASELKVNGREFFLKFFEFHPSYIDFFTSFRGRSLEELKTNKLVQAHGISVMYLFTTLIENLTDPGCFEKFMSGSIRVHRIRGVNLAQYQKIFEVLIFFLEKKLVDQFDEETSEAWHKFAGVFAFHVIDINQSSIASEISIVHTSS